MLTLHCSYLAPLSDTTLKGYHKCTIEKRNVGKAGHSYRCQSSSAETCQGGMRKANTTLFISLLLLGTSKKLLGYIHERHRTHSDVFSILKKRCCRTLLTHTQKQKKKNYLTLHVQLPIILTHDCRQYRDKNKVTSFHSQFPWQLHNKKTLMQCALHLHTLTKSQSAQKIYNTHNRHKEVKGENDNMSHCTEIKFT